MDEVLKEEKKGKKLYPYQEEAIGKIFEKLNAFDQKTNILFQLPTGGGKTIIFSEIARRYLKERQKKVLILTHRIELCYQTSDVLAVFDVRNKVITSEVKQLEDQMGFQSFTAMVETLNNRLQENSDFIKEIGLVIVDEAHYNSFRKIFHYFEDVNILGVTATPLSSNKNLPLYDNYKHLVIGESISSLVEKGYLCKAETISNDINTRGLKIGSNGEYTVESSEELYSSFLMQDKLVGCYEEFALGTKTLIFNSGIRTSQNVCKLFKKAGYECRHIDSTCSSQERKDVLTWFKSTPNAILTSVGILTTGFDEPSVETIVLNRATRSLTLYHQMIGRGSRILKNKKTFKILDLGNNARRLGIWNSYIDWKEVFEDPNKFLERQLEIERRLDEELELFFEFSPEVKENFPNTDLETLYSVRDTYKKLVDAGERPKMVIDHSLDNHFKIIQENAEDLYHGLELMKLLQDEIEHRVRQYAKCINGTENYTRWLLEQYIQKLRSKLRIGLN